MLTLSQLITARTKDALLALLVQALQGIGFVRHTGTGTGAVSASGVAETTASVVVEIVASGALGAATFRYSLDGGTTWSGTIVVPAGGSYVLSSTGATLVFAAGSATPAFVAGDCYSFEMATPSLPTTAYQDGSVPLTLLGIDAEALEDLESLVAAIAAGGFADYASGAWLDLLASSVYDLERIRATYTQGDCVLTAGPTAGPYTLGVGEVRATTASGKRFVNVTGGTLAAGGTLTLRFQAESPGSAWNVDSGEIDTLVTSLPGVTIENTGATPEAWITQFGDDDEPDSQLRARCKGRWSELGIAIAETYETWARGAATGNRKVTAFESPTVPGKVMVYVAPVIGGTANAAAAQAYIDERAPLTSTAEVLEATAVAIGITGTVHVEAGKSASAKAAAIAALTAYFDAAPIGGYDVGGAAGIIPHEKVAALIVTQDGVINVNLTAPAADTTLAATEHATFDPTLPGLTWVEV